MTQLQLQNFAESMGLTCTGPTIVGTWKGYPFMATLRPGRVNVLNVSFTYLRGPAPKQLRRLRKALPRGCALSWLQNKVMMVCSARDEQLEELFRGSMDMIADELRACGTTLAGACPLCRQSGCDGFALVSGAYVPVHQSCCQNHSNDAVSRAALNALEGNYFTGWIGALLGAVVGLIPTLILALTLEMISAWLCALIPLAAYYGYKLFKGKMDRMATVATVVCSLLQVFVMEQAISYISIVRHMNIWPSVFDSMAFYFEVMEVGNMVADMAMPLLFVVLGIIIVGGIIKRTNQTVTVDAGAMLDSLTDLNGVPVRPAAPSYAAARPAYQQPVQPAQPVYQQPAQPAQPVYQQPAQPAQPAYQQPAQPAQPMYQQPAQPAQPVYQQPAQPAQPAYQQPAQPAQPAYQQPARSVPTQTAWGQPVQPVVQASPTIPDVEPMTASLPDLPDLPDLPETPTMAAPGGDGEEKQ